MAQNFQKKKKENERQQTTDTRISVRPKQDKQKEREGGNLDTSVSLMKSRENEKILKVPRKKETWHTEEQRNTVDFSLKNEKRIITMTKHSLKKKFSNSNRFHNFYNIKHYLLLLQNSLSIQRVGSLSHSFGVIKCLGLEILGNLECSLAFSISLNSFIVYILPAGRLVT